MPGTSRGSTGAGRYAPSPTGDLHLGNLRTAVLAWLFARSTGRRFLLRIEDLDASRVRPGLAERQRADLAALGLDFDGEPVVQSSAVRRVRRRRWRALAGPDLRVLLHPAGDRRGRLGAARRAVGRYPGTCRDLTDGRAGRAAPATGRRPCGSGPTGRRQTITTCCTARSPARSTTSWSGATTGWRAYNLAVVVDDARQRAWTRWSAATTCSPAAINQA